MSEEEELSLDLDAASSAVTYSKIVKAETTRHFAGNPKRLVDIGCGWGRETFHYKNAVGLDRNLPSLKKARRYSDNEFVCGDAEHLPFRDGCFDFAIMSEVIEHLQHPEKALDEINRILEKKGRTVIQTPNRDVTRGVYTHKDHLHEFTAPELTALLNKHGFTVSRRTGSTIPFIPYGWKKLYHINSNSHFLSTWKILNKIIPIKWDMIILAHK